jgi:hypothetical protein
VSVIRPEVRRCRLVVVSYYENSTANNICRQGWMADRFLARRSSLDKVGELSSQLGLVRLLGVADFDAPLRLNSMT